MKCGIHTVPLERASAATVTLAPGCWENWLAGEGLAPDSFGDKHLSLPLFGGPSFPFVYATTSGSPILHPLIPRNYPLQP